MQEKAENPNEVIDFKQQALGGNFMPAIIMLEKNLIKVDDIIDENRGETLLHLAGRYTFYNVIRVLIEKFHADINKKNKSGHTLLYLIVSSNDYNIINFAYLIKREELETDIFDCNGMSPLAHSVMTSFHFAFLYFINEGLLEKYKDNYNNPLMYFAIAYNNKFVLSYLLNNKKNEINSKYFNNSKSLSDILITNQYNSITKFLSKYYYNEIDLNTIASCRNNIVDFDSYNIYNYELLNTLYFYKTKDYFGFISSIFKKHNIETDDKNNNNGNENNSNSKKNNYGYYYKIINLRFMIYNLILPNMSFLYKLLFIFIYTCILYFICNEKNNEQNENKRPTNYVYNALSTILFYLVCIILFKFKKPVHENKKTEKNNIESEISFKLKNKIEELPDIEEICPSCSIIKKISTCHCYKCGFCIPYKIFHSNLFGCCISKENILYYLLFLILKINFYYICLINCLKANPTNNGLICVIVPFWYKTSLKTFILQGILGGLILINLGHLISVLLCLSVKTPYKYIFEMDRKVNYNSLYENPNNKCIIQVPEINDGKKIMNIFNFIFKNE